MKTAMRPLLFVGLSFLSALGHDAPPSFPRIEPNLVPNGRFEGSLGWSLLQDAVYDAGESRSNDGSGSIKLTTPEQSFAISDLIPVEGGTIYTYSYHMKVDAGWPSLGGMQVKIFDRNRNAIRNIDCQAMGVTGPGIWQECVMAVHVPAEAFFVHLQAFKRENTQATGMIHIDEVYFGKGISLQERPSAKRPFVGSQTRIDDLGNIEIRNKNGLWTPFFPLAVYSDNDRDRQVYSNQGWNMDMWGGGAPGFAKAAVNAKSAFNPEGMYLGFSITEYAFSDGWNYQNTTALKENLEAIQRAGLGDHIVFYYHDNEVHHNEWEGPKAIMDFVHKTDVDAHGVPNRPIYALQGTYNLARQWAAAGLVDMTGTYLGGGYEATGGAGAGGSSALQIINLLQGQTNPVTIAQFNGVDGANEMRARLYHAIILGAKGMGYWRDGLHGRPDGPIDQKPWWPDFPNLRREIDQLLPLIRLPHWTAWKATCSSKALVFGSREYADNGNREGYLLVLNPQNTMVTATFSIQGLPYTPSSVKSYFDFDGEDVANCADASFMVTLRAGATAAYRLVNPNGPGRPVSKVKQDKSN